MEHRISTDELARRLPGVLDRVGCRGDAFVVTLEGEPVAKLVPLRERSATSLREAVVAWSSAGETEVAFADDLERVNAADRPPQDPWAP